MTYETCLSTNMTTDNSYVHVLKKSITSSHKELGNAPNTGQAGFCIITCTGLSSIQEERTMSKKNKYVTEFNVMAQGILRVAYFKADGSLEMLKESALPALKDAFAYEQKRLENDYFYFRMKNTRRWTYYEMQRGLFNSYQRKLNLSAQEIEKKYEGNRRLQVSNVEKYYRESMRKLNE